MKKAHFLLMVFMFIFAFYFAPFPKAEAAYPPFQMPMGEGAAGPEVSQLQSFLAADPGIYPEGIVSGYYGPLTKRAVKQFQLTYGILSRGYVGPVTLAQLNEINNRGQILDTHAPIITSITSDNGTINVQSSPTALASSGTASINNTNNTAVTVSANANESTNNVFAESVITNNPVFSGSNGVYDLTGGSAGSSSPSITINWTTNKPAVGAIYFSRTPIRLDQLNYYWGDYISPIDGTGTLVKANMTDGLTNNVTVQGLSSGATYYFLVEALDGSGNLSISWPSTFQS